MKAATLPRSALALALMVGLACPPGVSAAVREDWYMAARNHVEARISVLVATDDDGRQWIRELDLWQLDLPVPKGSTWRYAGETYVPLADVDARVRLDATSQWLHFLDGDAETGRAADGEIVADVIVNRQSLSQPYVLEERQGIPWLPPELLAEIRLQAPEGSADSKGWVPVTAVAGEHYLLDRDGMLLEFTVMPQGFSQQRIDGRTGRQRMVGDIEKPAAMPAVLLGYEASAGASSGGAGWSALALEAGVSIGNSYCASRHLWREREGTTRLESNCTISWPEKRISLVLGDVVSQGSPLGGAVRYGGLRLGTDQSLQPYLLTQPLLGLEGSARLPSVLEVWTDQQLSMRTELAPGDFVIDGLPALSGSGEIRAVVTDLLGRQTVVTVPFYSDPLLLRPGLTDWSLEMGRLRVGAGTIDESYGEAFGLATYRTGITSWWTAGGYVEGSQDHRRIAADSFLKLGKFGVLETSFSANRTDAIPGRGWVLGYTYRGRRWGFGLRELRRDGGYSDLAWPEPGSAPRRDRQVSLTVQAGTGTLSLGGVQQVDGAGQERSFVRAGLGMPVGPGHVSISALKSLGDEGRDSWMLMWFLPLGNSSVSAWVDGQEDGLSPGIALQRSQPRGPGYGYRVAWQEDGGQGDRLDADLRWRSGMGDGFVRAQRNGSGESIHASLAGTLLWAGGDLSPTPRFDGAYALVTLPAPGVRITHDNQVVASTDRNGRAVIPGLRPYEISRLGVIAEDLPMDVQLRQDAIALVAGRNQVVRADFQASARRSVTLRIVDAAGVELTPGAVGKTEPDGGMWPLGYGGLLYLEWDGALEAIVVERAGQPLCRIGLGGLPEKPAPGDIVDVKCKGAGP